MKASKQRKMAKAIVNNKALKAIESKRLTDMQAVVMSNQYKHDKRFWSRLNKSLQENGAN